MKRIVRHTLIAGVQVLIAAALGFAFGLVLTALATPRHETWHQGCSLRFNHAPPLVDCELAP